MCVVVYVLLSVCSGDHTEAVQLLFNPEETSYRELLDFFWKNHSCTSRMSRQYMSAIWYHNDEQKELALETMAEHQKVEKKKIVTVIEPAKTFYDAEE